MNTLNVVESIFIAALERGVPEVRAAYLEEACKGDANLRQCVERLLDAHAKAEKILPSQAPGLPASIEAPPIEERPGSVIGPFKLLQQLGEGGFGVVFMAEQEQPVRRKIALKIIKPGMDSRQVVARFEAERQALAIMDHPNIARVLDGGTTESGRPYFVMELVKGIPITEFCDQNRLTPRERLELFIPVCQAVQHAHQKGIIHRDIKPSNVLVTMYDNKPVPKVIDFGVAKAIEQKLTEQTLFTRVGQIIGTLEYMSPEQASLNALDVDTRADVYALGVLLYELLTGTTPLNKERLKEVAFLELLRRIREEEPPRPSMRLSESGDALTAYAVERRSDSQKLPKLVKGELDWIAMKALEKDRTRRYESATDLAADVQRYLNDEQVEACPPTVLYRLQKNARKHKTLIGMVGTVAALLLLGIVGTSWGWTEALTQRDQAEQARRDEEVQRRLALANAAEAKVNEKNAKDARAEAERLARHEIAARKQGDLARHKIEWQLYASQIAAAQREWEAGNIRLVDHYLDQCRNEFREFEHDYVYSLTSPHQDLRGHIKGVNSVVFSPDGKVVASASDDHTVKLWDSATGREILTFTGHTTGIHQVAFSPDGDRLASAGHVEKVHVWDAATGKIMLTLDAGWVMSLAFSPEGNRLVTGSRDNRVRVWDLAHAGKQVHLLQGHTEAISSVAFSPDGKRIASGSQDRTVKLWNAKDGKELMTLQGAVRVAFSRDSKRLAASNGKIAKVWDAVSGQELRQFQGHTNSIFGIAISPDGKRLATASMDKTVKLWDADSGRELLNLTDDNAIVNSVAFSPDGDRLATGSQDQTVKLWDVAVDANNKLIDTPKLDGKAKQEKTIDDAGGSVAFSCDGRLLASAGRRFGVPGKDQLKNLIKGIVRPAPEPSPLRIWNLATGKVIREFPVVRGDFRWPTWFAFSPDSIRVAGEGVRGAVTIWDTTTGDEVQRFEHGDSVHSAAFSPDGKILASAGSARVAPLRYQYDVKLWDVTTGKLLRKLDGQKGSIISLSFSPGGKRLISASIASYSEDDNARDPSMVKLWNVATGELIWTLDGPKTVPPGAAKPRAAFSPNGKHLATAGWGTTLKLLDAADGTTIMTLEGHTSFVHSVAFSPNGKRVVSGSADNTVRLWDVASGQNVLILRGGAKPGGKSGIAMPDFTGVAFSPDGKRLVGATDGTIRIWDASKSMNQTGQKQTTAQDPSPGRMIMSRNFLIGRILRSELA